MGKTLRKKKRILHIWTSHKSPSKFQYLSDTEFGPLKFDAVVTVTKADLE